MDRLIRFILRRLSGNGHKVPLFTVFIDLEKYKVNHKGSCDFYAIPDLADDEYIKMMCKDIIDYIRETYNCEEFIEPNKVFELYKAKGVSDELAMKLTASTFGIQPINKPSAEVFFGKL